ncbi:MAG: lipase family alpha/beta hydrolase [Candidatus Saccharibacteria bacterium]
MGQKRYDLVLLHGLTNRHRWSDQFLNRCLEHWGSGHVYPVYLNHYNDVSIAPVQEKLLISIGKNNYTAGCACISAQAGILAEKVKILQENHGLSSPFYIIAHSLGGVVARCYIHHNPNAVAGLVTLATPHHGSPMARDYGWFSHVLGAKNAFDNLTPEYMSKFNRLYPINQSPLFGDGKIFTVRGIADGKLDEWGWGGETILGWYHMKLFHNTLSDGLVPDYSAVIEGAHHIGDFPHHAHMDLVTNPSVAQLCSEYLC